MGAFGVQSATRNEPYVHPRLDSVFELCRTFPIAAAVLGFWKMVCSNPVVMGSGLCAGVNSAYRVSSFT